MIWVALGCVWLVAANVLALVPSRDNHWSRAYVLIALGVPLLGGIFYANGLWIGLAFLIAGASILRWPVIYLLRWVRRTLGRARPS
ncbi:DUF2484 family protein [Thalassorhabdomicrobium marinisediminis]|uniref:DUF2484 domain-containing protein n=1 Tax=Thalassorhabdomicrobium marinisediminis TaxID=2170577 RepID=A0A2T7FXX9_9RHOB|nr:DUF2484 family protein [Thalassorhabdomicrobium marinisediminis]PVA07017.1 hypothetical protein DC363_07705 [Thalassorhabdomicrobium marinisediminis]